MEMKRSMLKSNEVPHEQTVIELTEEHFLKESLKSQTSYCGQFAIAYALLQIAKEMGKKNDQ